MRGFGPSKIVRWGSTWKIMGQCFSPMISLFSYFTIPLRWPTTISTSDMWLQQVLRFLAHSILVSFKSIGRMLYRLENVYIVTSIRSCQFPQGDIYWPRGRWSNMWGLSELGQDSQGFRGVNSTYLTTARLGGTFLRYRLSKTAMTSSKTQMITQYCPCLYFRTTPMYFYQKNKSKSKIRVTSKQSRVWVSFFCLCPWPRPGL